MLSPLPPLYALRAFDAAALCGSFTRAALMLHVTPGAISRHIRTLEENFHCQLFLRNGPAVELTDAGRILASQLRNGFATLESACEAFRTTRHGLRLKAPSTLTLNWLLNILKIFVEENSTPEVHVSSVWMDVDHVDFYQEPFDCAILLGNGQFGEQTVSQLLFKECLAPVCAPGLLEKAQHNISACELIHPSPDRRDWRRWLKGSPFELTLDISKGKVFDTLEQGNQAAAGGFGVSVGDVALSIPALESGLLVMPFTRTIETGDGYYLVWPSDSPKQQGIETLCAFLLGHIPDISTCVK
ncbi:LysR family transcriptional regulator [Enterobacter sp. RHBSTW-00994]|uniref:LysR family transcriptional regulator n=1 Tax=Enterobacter sp. RHBSTW-00994 TaxID=2742676 RepID=UPI0015EAD6E0|nr:LysR family transcriptional regulator [Enterobacter sp. RHBSTW-00994]QLR43005.1 LysR family transcriptional regulator [Enterobacter sp. RHBSTW-00994]